MTIQALKRKIEKEGFETRETFYTDKNGNVRKAFFVIHDYDGLYPDKKAYEIHDHSASIARKAGFHAEQRGHYVSTIIY